MRKIRLGDYCCQGGDIVIDSKTANLDDMVLKTEGDRELIFSPLGNAPTRPRLAIVGITPGGQSKNFFDFLKSTSVENAARMAAFKGAHNVIRELLSGHGFLQALRLDCPRDVNSSPAIFTTSLVKCCFKVNGGYNFKAPDIAASNAATYCVINRFVSDLERFDTLTHVAIFGLPGWEAVNALKYKNSSIREYFEGNGINFLNFPHFAQNQQQREIFLNEPTADADLMKRKPHYLPYFGKAVAMRSELIAEVRRLNG